MKYFLIELIYYGGFRHEHPIVGVMSGESGEDVESRARAQAIRYFCMGDNVDLEHVPVEVARVTEISDSDAGMLLRLGISNLDESCADVFAAPIVSK